METLMRIADALDLSGEERKELILAREKAGKVSEANRNRLVEFKAPYRAEERAK